MISNKRRVRPRLKAPNVASQGYDEWDGRILFFLLSRLKIETDTKAKVTMGYYSYFFMHL